jgi:hypothetical protein
MRTTNPVELITRDAEPSTYLMKLITSYDKLTTRSSNRTTRSVELNTNPVNISSLVEPQNNTRLLSRIRTIPLCSNATWVYVSFRGKPKRLPCIADVAIATLPSNETTPPQKPSCAGVPWVKKPFRSIKRRKYPCVEDS